MPWSYLRPQEPLTFQVQSHCPINQIKSNYSGWLHRKRGNHRKLLALIEVGGRDCHRQITEEPRKFGAKLQDLRIGEISPIFSLVRKAEEMCTHPATWETCTWSECSKPGRPDTWDLFLPSPPVRRRYAEQVTQCLCTSVSCTTKWDALPCLFHKMVIWGGGGLVWLINVPYKTPLKDSPTWEHVRNAESQSLPEYSFLKLSWWDWIA